MLCLSGFELYSRWVSLIIEGNVNHTKTFYDEPIILWDKIAMLFFIIIISNLDADRNGFETWFARSERSQIFSLWDLYVITP